MQDVTASLSQVKGLYAMVGHFEKKIVGNSFIEYWVYIICITGWKRKVLIIFFFQSVSVSVPHGGLQIC